MSDNERLEEIKERFVKYEYDYNLNGEDIEWLIEQAERAEKNAQDLEDMDRQLYSEQQQNKRYKQALEFYADKENYFLKQRKTSSFYTPIELDKGEKARQALEGDDD